MFCRREVSCKVRATFALLTNRDIENAVNRLAWQINLRWHTGVTPRCLAPHISLKQPFEIGHDLAALERYMAAFTSDVPPVPIDLTGFYAWETVFGLDVKETPVLRALHYRLNRELPTLFGDVNALHDGEEYHFHLTIATGGASAEKYRSIYSENSVPAFTATFTAHELALFVYNERESGESEYMTHTVLPLTGS
jgi:2'-5' RNA ligase